MIPQLIPGTIPDVPIAGGSPPPPVESDAFSLYDVAIGGIGFHYSNTPEKPMQRETAPFEKDRVDQAQTAGEQTLLGWWIKSQDSFHAGAGQLQLEPAVPTPVSHVRYDLSKNVDPSVPGQLTRLPDTSVVTSTEAVQMVAAVRSGTDAIVYLTAAGDPRMMVDPLGTPAPLSFTHSTPILALATDGRFVYGADSGHVYSWDVQSPTTQTTVATFPTGVTDTTPVLGWVKNRLMLGAGGGVYALDVSTSGVTLSNTGPYFVYQHPTKGFRWRCFAEAPGSILAAGDANGLSTITSFTTVQVAGAPVLQVDGVTATLPSGERVLSMLGTLGTFLAIGTDRGVRVASFNAYGTMTYGPLLLSPTDPVIPAVSLLARDRFVYAVGQAYDEPGLIAVDLGTQTDQAGRFAWWPHLTGPVAGAAGSATAGCVLTLSNRVAMSLPGEGVVVEQSGPGTSRQAFLRTSRIRFGTTEPKLFKVGRVRGRFATGEAQVSSLTADGATPLLTVGNTTSDPQEFKLVDGGQEWMQLSMNLIGPVAIQSYQVKALPGTKRERHIQLVLAMFDKETGRSGQRIRDPLLARDRLAELEALDAAGDEVTLEEFTPSGVIKTTCVIERVSYSQTGRPSAKSDIGGDVSVLLRTVNP